MTADSDVDPDHSAPDETAEPAVSRVTFAHVKRLAATRDFRRLVSVRVAGQFGDGTLQAALTSFVLLDPTRKASAAQVAGVLAILLVPYSVLGPFAGALIDRWQRRQVLLVANLVRAAVTVGLTMLIAAGSASVLFAVVALAITSVNRFVLAALPASQPHVVDPEDLVAANALAPILGSIGTLVGGAAGIWLRVVLGEGDSANASVSMVTVLAYALAGVLALRLARDSLGPDDGDARPTVSIVGVFRALVAALRHLRTRPPAMQALGSVAGMRIGLGLWTVATIVQERSLLHPVDDVDASLASLGLVAACAGAGGALSALVTPRAVGWLGAGRWVGSLLLLGSVAVALLMPRHSQEWVMTLAVVLGFVAQAVKICADTDLQVHVDDAFRGRAFSINDLLNNVCMVLAAVAAALVLPPDGTGALIVVLTAAAYALVGTTYLWARRRSESAAAVTRSA